MKFKLGTIVATPGAIKLLKECNQSPTDFLKRHARGDWGELSAHDKQQNEEALQTGARLLSSYPTSNGEKLWIITEADDEEGNREATTFLLPDEY